jgi:hypothetical protein
MLPQQDLGHVHRSHLKERDPGTLRLLQDQRWQNAAAECPQESRLHIQRATL